MSVNIEGRMGYGYGNPDLKLEFSSGIKLEEFVIEWKVDASTAVWTNETIESPVFVGGQRGQHSWQLLLKPSFPYRHSYKIGLYCLRIGNCSINGELHGKVFLHFKKPDAMKELHSAAELATFPLDEILPGYPGAPSSSSTILADTLMEEKNGFIVDGILTIYCRIIVRCGTKHSRVLKTALPNFGSEKRKDTVPANKSHVERMMALLTSATFADAKIITTAKTIPVHKDILAVHSSVFAAMFQTTMREATKNVVEIKDFEQEVVEEMLKYMYTGETSKHEFHETTTPDLFRISDKYELLELKHFAENLMCLNLKVENAAEFFHLAMLHNSKTLKTAALRFIHANKLKVGETEFFKELVKADPSLLLELYLSI